MSKISHCLLVRSESSPLCCSLVSGRASRSSRKRERRASTGSMVRDAKKRERVERAGSWSRSNKAMKGTAKGQYQLAACGRILKKECHKPAERAMGRITRAKLHLPVEEVKERMDSDPRPLYRKRWLIIYNALVDPREAKDIAKHTGVSMKTVHKLISTYNRLGIAAVETPGKGGRRNE